MTHTTGSPDERKGCIVINDLLFAVWIFGFSAGLFAVVALFVSLMEK